MNTGIVYLLFLYTGHHDKYIHKISNNIHKVFTECLHKPRKSWLKKEKSYDIICTIKYILNIVFRVLKLMSAVLGVLNYN